MKNWSRGEREYFADHLHQEQRRGDWNRIARDLTPDVIDEVAPQFDIMRDTGIARSTEDMEKFAPRAKVRTKKADGGIGTRQGGARA